MSAVEVYAIALPLVLGAAGLLFGWWYGRRDHSSK